MIFLKIIKVRSEQELGEQAATLVLNQVKQKPSSTLGMATGSTPKMLYTKLIECFQKKDISFSNITTFNLDEYIGLERDHPNSYHYYMDHQLFNHIDIDKKNTYIPDGLTADLEQECQRYELLIKKRGGIDLQIVGLGLNGHIGFNEPGTAFSKRTHIIELTPSTRAANKRFFNHIDIVPKHAITMGISTIMEAKKVLLLVLGRQKAPILQKVLYGDVTEQVPASILQRHPQVTLITDIHL